VNRYLETNRSLLLCLWRKRKSAGNYVGDILQLDTYPTERKEKKRTSEFFRSAVFSLSMRDNNVEKEEEKERILFQHTRINVVM